VVGIFCVVCVKECPQKWQNVALLRISFSHDGHVVVEGVKRFPHAKQYVSPDLQITPQEAHVIACSV
jgi:hypothetical protein